MAAVAVASVLLATAVHATPLPHFRIDPHQVGVSGVSAGGAMAVQLHVIHSLTFTAGAGIVAAGPYLCARTTQYRLSDRCAPHGAALPVEALATATRQRAAEGLIDPVEALAKGRVYLSSGVEDPPVLPAVMDGLHAYYRHFLPAAHIAYPRPGAAGAGGGADLGSSRCAPSAPQGCDEDLAGAVLAQVHGPLSPRNDGRITGRWMEFDQMPYGGGAHGLAATGWLFVPQTCSSGDVCRLHVVLHGCQQNTSAVGDRFVRQSGHARWADANRIVLLFPQTGDGAEDGCWDWWGYDSPRHADRLGPQVRAIKAMVDRLAGAPLPPPPVCHTATNLTHIAEGRAFSWWGVMARAAGTEEPLGWALATTTLKPIGRNAFESGSCAGVGAALPDR